MRPQSASASRKLANQSNSFSLNKSYNEYSYFKLLELFFTLLILKQPDCKDSRT